MNLELNEHLAPAYVAKRADSPPTMRVSQDYLKLVLARLRTPDLEVETQFYKTARNSFEERYPRRKFKIINDERNAIQPSP